MALALRIEHHGQHEGAVMPDLRLGFFQKGVEVGFDEPLECGFLVPAVPLRYDPRHVSGQWWQEEREFGTVHGDTSSNPVNLRYPNDAGVWNNT